MRGADLMRWFWRTTISMFAAWFVGVVGYGSYRVVRSIVSAVRGTYPTSQEDAMVNLIWTLWLLLLVIGLPTAFIYWRARKRIPPGHCRACGYNLTGNVSGVCPECGEQI
jgi:hypothetical protein